MAMISARVAALGLALAVFCSSQQACAFGLRLGPLFGVRFAAATRRLFSRAGQQTLKCRHGPSILKCGTLVLGLA
jgi:hypothetical protein